MTTTNQLDPKEGAQNDQSTARPPEELENTSGSDFDPSEVDGTTFLYTNIDDNNMFRKEYYLWTCNQYFSYKYLNF